MALPDSLRRFTPAEYLSVERDSPYRSELVDGQMYAMTRASFAHNLITANLVALLHGRLRDQDCTALANDLRVHTAHDDSYFYSDVVVLCGEPPFEDSQQDTLLNPIVIFEVPSPSTERYDRTTKLDAYTQIPSLAMVVLVAQDQAQVEVFERRGEDWLRRVESGLDAALALPALGCQLLLAEVYERVTVG